MRKCCSLGLSSRACVLPGVDLDAAAPLHMPLRYGTKHKVSSDLSTACIAACVTHAEGAHLERGLISDQRRCALTKTLGAARRCSEPLPNAWLTRADALTVDCILREANKPKLCLLLARENRYRMRIRAWKGRLTRAETRAVERCRLAAARCSRARLLVTFASVFTSARQRQTRQARVCGFRLCFEFSLEVNAWF